MPKRKYKFHFKKGKKRTVKRKIKKRKTTTKRKTKRTILNILGSKFKIRHKRVTKRKKGRTIKILKQHGTSNIKADRKRKALTPGKRVSRYGNKYTETRKNRSDKKGKKV